jgi:integrase
LRKPSGIVFTYEVATIHPVDGNLVRKIDHRPIHRIKTAWKGALRRAGIPHYRFHDLRHTFNSRLAEIGIIADVRKELMGHSGGGDVHSMYTHIELPTLRDAIQRLEAWHTAKRRALEQAGEADALSQNRTLTTEKEEPRHG